MRRPFIAGNWKMNMDRTSAVALASGVARQATAHPAVDVAVCPPSLYLEAVGKAIAGSRVGLGAQNMYFQPKGAFTGEISPGMLKDIGCQYVILGHSERRQFFGESSELVNEKVFAALEAGLVPIVCLGEMLAQRKSGKTMEVIRRQFEGSLSGLTGEQMMKVVIAYEPVWAIGTGVVATTEQAEEVHRELRKLIETRYNKEVAEAVRIQYGGSVKADNAKELLACPNIDGALVGGASLTVGDFLGIIAGAPK